MSDVMKRNDEITLKLFGHAYSEAVKQRVCVRCGSGAVSYECFSDDNARWTFCDKQLCERCQDPLLTDPDAYGAELGEVEHPDFNPEGSTRGWIMRRCPPDDLVTCVRCGQRFSPSVESDGGLIVEMSDYASGSSDHCLACWLGVGPKDQEESAQPGVEGADEA